MKVALFLVALSAMLVLGVASLPSSGAGLAEAAGARFSHSVQESPSTVAPGGSVKITTNVTRTNSTGRSANIDVEIYKQDGTKVFERFWENEWYDPGQTITHQMTWSVPQGASLETYSIQLGVFSPDWSYQYFWDSNAGGVTVARSTSSAPPTNTPMPGATSTRTPMPGATNTRTPTPGATNTPNPIASSTPTRVATNTPTRVATSTPTRVPTNTPTPVPSSGGSMSGLHIVGNQIKNGAGNSVQLNGVNRADPSWLCTDGNGIIEGPADQSEADTMRSWNIHAVRIALNEDCWLGINGVDSRFSGANYQNRIAQYVNLLTSNNIAAVVEEHFAAPGSQVSNGSPAMPDRDHSADFWRSLANRFKGNSAVVFELYNEPHPDNAHSDAAWSCWRDGGNNCPGVGYTAAGMQELLDAIRSTGARNPVIVPGNNWESDVSRWLEFKPNDSINQLAAGWHSYGDGLDCQDEACWNSTLANVLQNYPIVSTELGEFDCAHGYIDRVMNFFDQHFQGYQGWAWGPYGCSGNPALISDWSGTPTQTFGSGFQSHLRSRP